ncbi:uncharacterized protein [Haliotis cracherodii]|uniref:uncharacterized protein n=1 Tax=Haliotis cracherodii TaxID=6455 RepID=UPI0039EC5644
MRKMNQVKVMAVFILGTCLVSLLIYYNYTEFIPRVRMLLALTSRDHEKTTEDIIATVQKGAINSVIHSKQEASLLYRNTPTPTTRRNERLPQMLQQTDNSSGQLFLNKSRFYAVLGEGGLENRFPPRRPYQSEFQQVDVRIFIYSAIYENTHSSVRTLILVPEPFHPVSFVCVLKRTRSHKGYWVQGHFQHIPPSRWGTYNNRCGFVHCPVPHGSYPAFISVLTARMSSPLNILPVNYPGPPYNRLTHCYPALHGNFTDVNTLVTALETSRYLGTDKFLIYNYSIPEEVNKVLLHYEREGIVEMRNWKLPFPPDQIHYWGQMASIHDCVFSQLGVAKYVLLADVDEIVVPKKHISLVALADRLLNAKKPDPQNVYGALMFQNAFFPIYESETKVKFPEKKDAKKFKMHAFLHTYRSCINKPGDRSKILVKPEVVNLIHVHEMEKFLPGRKMYVVSPKVALMHHYRASKDPKMYPPWSQDFTFIKFSNILIPKIKDRLLHLQGKLGVTI